MATAFVDGAVERGRKDDWSGRQLSVHARPMGLPAGFSGVLLQTFAATALP